MQPVSISLGRISLLARLVPATATKPKPDVRAAVEAMKQLRKGQTLRGLSVREMIEEGRRF
jgi:hypothetical protein